MTKPLTIELIHSRCDEVGDCWIWTGALTGPGYPSMTYGGKRGMNLRREVLRIEGRPSPAGHRVINTCLNPKCLNPAHLKSLTPAQFNAWLGRRGRLSTPAVKAARTRSARDLRAKLTIEAARAIRARRAEGATIEQLGAEFGVHKSLAARICRGEAWREAPAGASVFTMR